MIESATRHNARDFRQRYEGTIGFIQTDTGNQLVLITGVNDRRVTFQDKHGRVCEANHDKDIKFEFTQVTHGWHNADEKPLFMTRRPARMWQRGICEANTNLYEVNKAGILAHIPISMESVSRIYAYTPKSTKTPEVLSRQFAVQAGILWFFDKHAGEVKNNVITLNGVFDIAQELGDVIRRNNYGYTLNV